MNLLNFRIPNMIGTGFNSKGDQVLFLGMLNQILSAKNLFE